MLKVPTQERAVDPFSSFDSDNVNRLTRIQTLGKNVIISGLGVTADATSNVQLNMDAGIMVKDDVLIDIKTPTQLRIDDPNDYIEGSVLSGDGKIYAVIKYTYLKQKPAKVAEIGLLKTTAVYNNEPKQYLFLARVDQVGGSISSVQDFDPDDLTIKREIAEVGNATTIRGFNISEADPLDGEVLVFDSGTNTWIPGVGVGSASSIQGFNVSSVAPADGEVLVWVNAASEWQPGLSGGTTVIFPFFEGDGTPNRIDLIAGNKLPFFKTDGGASDILLIT